jgi:hypothetical protein
MNNIKFIVKNRSRKLFTSYEKNKDDENYLGIVPLVKNI